MAASLAAALMCQTLDSSHFTSLALDGCLDAGLLLPGEMAGWESWLLQANLSDPVFSYTNMIFTAASAICVVACSRFALRDNGWSWGSH